MNNFSTYSISYTKIFFNMMDKTITLLKPSYLEKRNHLSIDGTFLPCFKFFLN
ncbi:hypothetical protein PNI0010_01671 [Streptococcus pneumoniae PNI0010]|nr:hypothetical protein PNI0010_01671 [Streptococcus pneumoniae PNI0010]